MFSGGALRIAAHCYISVPAGRTHPTSSAILPGPALCHSKHIGSAHPAFLPAPAPIHAATVYAPAVFVYFSAP